MIGFDQERKKKILYYNCLTPYAYVGLLINIKLMKSCAMHRKLIKGYYDCLTPNIGVYPVRGPSKVLCFFSQI